MGPAIEPDTSGLFEGCRRGDAEALAETYRQFGNSLYGTALRVLGSPEEAEEVVQETFLTLMRKAPELRVRNLGGWLRRVTTNRCIDRIRRRRPQVEADDGPLLSSPAPHAAAGMDIERAVRRLPDRAREVFLLHDVEGFRHREIAEMLGVAEGTSKSQLFRARELLRQMLTETTS